MAEYIERERVLASAVFVHGKWDDTYVSAEKIEEIPAADVAPVRRGRWENSENRTGFCMCSRCRSRDSNNQPFYRDLWKYCPSCGAKMDGGDDHKAD